MRYETNAAAYDVRLEPKPDGTYTAYIGDVVYENVRIQRGADGGLLIEMADGGRGVVYVAGGCDDERHVHHAGVTHTLTVANSANRRGRRTGAGSGDLTAQMPGQVVAVLVAEGDTVTAGQALVVLEAMKMEIRVSAPVDGVVAHVHVNEGDVVERGQSLVDVTADPA